LGICKRAQLGTRTCNWYYCFHNQELSGKNTT
jgi:hypothetical protein